MPNCCAKKLQQYAHQNPDKTINTPLQPLTRKFGTAAQEPAPPDESPLLNETDRTYIQQVTGIFLYYGRAVVPIILTPSVQ